MSEETTSDGIIVLFPPFPSNYLVILNFPALMVDRTSVIVEPMVGDVRSGAVVLVASSSRCHHTAWNELGGASWHILLAWMTCNP
jgi:hypothetical protein